MEDKVDAIRAKRDSSIRVGLRLVREGQAVGFVTAGNTGAAMAAAKVVLGALPGVDRPALAAAFPTVNNTAAVLLDVGGIPIAPPLISNSSPSWAIFIAAQSLG